MKPWPLGLRWPVYLVVIWIVYGCVDAAGPWLLMLKKIECDDMFKTDPDSMEYKACMKKVESWAEMHAMQEAHLKQQPAIDWIREHAEYDHDVKRYKLAFAIQDVSGSHERYVYLPSNYQPVDISDVNREPIPDEDDHDATFLKMKRRITLEKDDERTRSGVTENSKATAMRSNTAQERILPNQEEHTPFDPEAHRRRTAEERRPLYRRKNEGTAIPPQENILLSQGPLGPENKKSNFQIENKKTRFGHSEMSNGEENHENINFGDRIKKMRSKSLFNGHYNVEDPKNPTDQDIKSETSKIHQKGNEVSPDITLNKKEKHVRNNFEPIHDASKSENYEDSKLSSQEMIFSNEEADGNLNNHGYFEFAKKQEASAYTKVAKSGKSNNEGENPEKINFDHKIEQMRSRMIVEGDKFTRSPSRLFTHQTSKGASKDISMGVVDSQGRKHGFDSQTPSPRQSLMDDLANKGNDISNSNFDEIPPQTIPQKETHWTNPDTELSQINEGKINDRSDAYTQTIHVNPENKAPEDYSGRGENEEYVDLQSNEKQSTLQESYGPQTHTHWLFENKKPSENDHKPEKPKKRSLLQKISCWFKRNCSTKRSKNKNKIKVDA